MTFKFTKKYFLLLAAISWFALVTQFILMISNRVVGIPETILRFFCFFTILSNILVAVIFTSELFNDKSKTNFFLNSVTQSAVAVYITIVGIVYNGILRFIWQPQGLQRFVDELLHLVIPLLYVIFWYANVTKPELRYKQIFIWLIFPAFYCVVVLFLGSFSNYYPYPFLNVNNLGMFQVILNSIYLTLFFGIVSLVFVRINLRKRKH